MERYRHISLRGIIGGGLLLLLYYITAEWETSEQNIPFKRHFQP
jgi:hypothetical protein